MSEKISRNWPECRVWGCGILLLLLAMGSALLLERSSPSLLQAEEFRVIRGRLPLVATGGRGAWTPEQATGEPDTPDAGDYATAWASETPDDQPEWLILQYAEAIVPKAVLIHETYNPGAVSKVTAFRADGTEVEAWKGKDPTSPNQPRGISEIALKLDFATQKIKLYLDSPQFPGWNEIDAVGLRDSKNGIQWAKSAQASSTFGQVMAIGRPGGKRAWGPEQALGEPDTPQAGDIQTAWASSTPDGAAEWLMLEYETPLAARAVIIHETYNPGAVYKITAVDPQGKEVEIWTGIDPTPQASEQGVSVIPVKLADKIQKIKLYIDSQNVAGWNEIDAVGLRDTQGQDHWATKAEASSTFGAGLELSGLAPVEMPSAMALDRILKLEAEVARLKDLNAKLSALEAEVRELRKQLQEQRQSD